MATKLNLVDFVEFSRKGRKELAEQRSYIADARKRTKYEDGKAVSGVYDGTVLTIQIERGEKYANSRYNLIVADMYEPEDVIDCDVRVIVDDAKVYARSSKGTTYAGMEVSLHGHVEFLDADDEISEDYTDNAI